VNLIGNQELREISGPKRDEIDMEELNIIQAGIA